MATALPKSAELFLRSAFCCVCCGLEANVRQMPRYCRDSSLSNWPPYETTAFLTWEDLLKLLVPICFSVLSFAGVLFHIVYPLFYNETLYVQLILGACVSFITSTYACRYIYTFETSISKRIVLDVVSNYMCLEKYFALILSIASGIAFSFNLLAYFNYYASYKRVYVETTNDANSATSLTTSPPFINAASSSASPRTEVLTSYFRKNEGTIFLINLLWEASMFLWSTVWYFLVLRALKYKKEHPQPPPINYRGERGPVFFALNPQFTPHYDWDYPYIHRNRNNNEFTRGGGNNYNNSNGHSVYAVGSVYAAELHDNSLDKKTNGKTTTGNVASNATTLPVVGGAATAIFQGRIADNNNDVMRNINTGFSSTTMRTDGGGIHPVTIGRPVMPADGCATALPITQTINPRDNHSSNNGYADPTSVTNISLNQEIQHQNS